MEHTSSHWVDIPQVGFEKSIAGMHDVAVSSNGSALLDYGMARTIDGRHELGRRGPAPSIGRLPAV
jgi:hypothetical protein